MSEIKHAETIIELGGVSFSYGAQKVLDAVTLAIHRGEYVGIIGPNGAGKTTLLKIILGLLTPSSGRVRLFGKELRAFVNWPAIGYVPQKATNFDQHFPATVYEVALMGRYGRRGLFHDLTSEDRQLTRTALEQVSMWEYKDRLIGELSGGQQQRVFIARALAGEPEVIFLDEPTIGIDAGTSEEFYTLLRKLRSSGNLSLVLISHDIEMVLHEASRIAYIDRGLIFDGTPKEFQTSAVGEQLTMVSRWHHH